MNSTHPTGEIRPNSAPPTAPSIAEALDRAAGPQSLLRDNLQRIHDKTLRLSDALLLLSQSDPDAAWTSTAWLLGEAAADIAESINSVADRIKGGER